MPAELLPDVWPWEWIWPLATAAATLTGLSLVVLFIQRRGLRGRQPWLRWVVLVASLPLVVMPFFVYDDWPQQLWRPQSVVETTPDSTDPDLKTRIFPLPPQFVFDQAVKVVQAMPTWRLTRQDAEAGLISAEVSIALGLFTNDVLIHVGSVAPNGAQVDVRASARRPGGDLGTTEREVASFYRRLDRLITDPVQ